jgi:hypothetical protein
MKTEDFHDAPATGGAVATNLKGNLRWRCSPTST